MARLNPAKDIPLASSSDQEWINWHKQLDRWFKRNEANLWFVKGWNHRGGGSMAANTERLQKYMKRKGIDPVTGSLAKPSTNWIAWVGVTVGVVGLSYFAVKYMKQPKLKL